GQPLTFQEEQLVRDLLLENWHSQTGHQNKRVEALELLVRGGPAAESLFANFMETLKSLDREDKDFKKRVPGGRAQGSVGHDLFSNPLQYLLFPVDYGPYAGIHDADTLRGYLAYLKTHPI
ncbi:MAG TPA: hypothetical protein VI874_02580, partial [Candidatus Norongarragalinales archaeon]|nr:hypothetical protein [Candidatus Norongarragalinales archaeon]